MKLIRLLSIALTCALTTARAELVERPEPYVLARALRDLQNRIVTGDASARTQQSKLVSDIGVEFVRAPRAIWASPRNARALAVYLIGGGSSKVAREILDLGTLSRDEIVLVKGALAYAEGRRQEATTLLGRIDPLAVSPDVAGHLALTMGSLRVQSDPAKAMGDFAIARLTSPGGVVEETALRREALLALQIEDFDRCALAFARYVRRFDKSIYAEPFRASLLSAASGLSAKVMSIAFPKLAGSLDELAGDRRAGVYLEIAFKALLAGQLTLATRAAEAAGATAKPTSRERARAVLYRAAGSLASADPTEVEAMLTTVSNETFDAPDEELRSATSLFVSALRSNPARMADGRSERGPEPTESMKLARSALDESARLLARAMQ